MVTLEDRLAFLDATKEVLSKEGTEHYRDSVTELRNRFKQRLEGSLEGKYLSQIALDAGVREEVLDTPIQQLGLSKETYTTLIASGILYTGEMAVRLRELTSNRILKKISVDEIRWIAAKYNIPLEIKEYSRPAPTDKEIDELKNRLNMTVDELSNKYHISVRLANVLLNMEMFELKRTMYLGDVVQRTEALWLRQRDFGRKSLDELKSALAQETLYLGMIKEYTPPEQRTPTL